MATNIYGQGVNAKPVTEAIIKKHQDGMGMDYEGIKGPHPRDHTYEMIVRNDVSRKRCKFGKRCKWLLLGSLLSFMLTAVVLPWFMKLHATTPDNHVPESDEPSVISVKPSVDESTTAHVEDKDASTIPPSGVQRRRPASLKRYPSTPPSLDEATTSPVEDKDPSTPPVDEATTAPDEDENPSTTPLAGGQRRRTTPIKRNYPSIQLRANEEGRHNLVLGDNGPSDVILYTDFKKVTGRIVSRTQSHTFRYYKAYNEIITAVLVVDNWDDDTGGTPERIDGGPGENFVEIKVTSKFGRGFSFTFYVYGQRH